MENLKFKTYKGTNIISWDFGNYKSCGKRFMVAYTNGKERWEGKPQEERELSHKKPEYGGNKNLYWEVA